MYIAKNSTIFIILCLFAPKLSGQHCYVFFGSFTRDKTSESLYVYQLDTSSGQLTKVSALKNLSNPSYLALSPSGQCLYSCTESKTAGAGSVSSFRFNPENGSMVYMNRQKSGGENPVYVSVHRSGKWLVNGNYTEGSVSVYPLTDSGKIEPALQNLQFTVGSVNRERQDRSHIHAAVFSPDFSHVFLTDLGADKIRAYRFDSASPQPLQMAEQPFIKTKAGSGPRHFTFHPNGQFVYSIEELSGSINAYTYGNGKLDSIQRVNTHPGKGEEGHESSDIHISPDGRFLYASNRGNENNIAIFSIGGDGKLSFIAYQSTFGLHPRIFAIDGTGRFIIIVTHVVSGNVIVFRRDMTTGLLSKTGQEIKINNVSCVKTRQY